MRSAGLVGGWCRRSRVAERLAAQATQCEIQRRVRPSLVVIVAPVRDLGPGMIRGFHGTASWRGVCRGSVRNGPLPNVLDRRKVEFSGLCHAGGLDTPARSMREAAGLLPIAPCGRSSLYNPASEHPSVYAIEGKRLCWARSDPVGYRALRCARSTKGFNGVPLNRELERRSRAVRERVTSFDLASFGGKPQRLGRDLEEPGGVGEVEPGLDAIGRGSEHRDAIVRPHGGDAFARPAVAVAGLQAVAVEKTGDQVVASDQHQLAHGRDDVGRCAIALPAPSLR